MASGLVTYDPWKGVQEIGTMWEVTKGPHSLRCSLWSHPLGWELRAAAGDDLRRSQVCRHEADVFTTAEEWKAEALRKGWVE